MKFNYAFKQKYFKKRTEKFSRKFNPELFNKNTINENKIKKTKKSFFLLKNKTTNPNIKYV